MTTVTIELPDELADQLPSPGQDLARAALEALALEAFRADRLSENQMAQLLGLDRYELDGFLKAHSVWLDYSMDDLRREGEHGQSLLADALGQTKMKSEPGR